MIKNAKFAENFGLLVGLSNPHLGAISHFSSDAIASQEKFDNATHKHDAMPLMQLVQSYSLGAIICSFSFLEAQINDFYGRCIESDQLVRMGMLTETQCHVIKMLATGQGFDRLETLTKFTEALRLAEKPPFDKGREPWQSIDQIRRFRNALIHYKHESSEEQQREKKALLKIMRTRHIEPIWDPDEFPDSYLTSAAASWAAKSARDFFMAFVFHLSQ